MAVIRLVRPAFDGGVGLMVAAALRPAADSTVLITAASSEEDETPSTMVVVVAFGLLVLAAIAALVADQMGKLPATLSLAENMNAFALFYVAAQGIERLLEPFTYFVKSTEPTKETLEEKKGEALTEGVQATALDAAKAAANAKAKLARLRSERSILFWAVASIVGVLVSAGLGLHFISMVLSQASQAAVPAWLDVVATGLVIGGGTKALHDLIGRISKPADTGNGEAV